MSTKYIIAQDDDGHWFVIPADKDEEFAEYVEAVGRYWVVLPENEELPVLPDWADEVGGALSRVEFSDYEIN